ncbi:carboxymuconolactone decarboxylase family protein [Mycolicibacterium crocinum]|uniref:Carboxymuconolactone decarboxylase family protein n=1 Tax=Mycolicibacterium crocinum TaxID=388459 RepID=A0ABY3TGP0_9MYCO|nr:carboxymuconolactone decarboxylase family protein [Mycolicibacterium crocinum]ULN39894.1 carboxymuconolactone decarboxylase family protein [Mycolicibacterium crocinum]
MGIVATMTRYKNHSEARVAPAASPLPADIQGSIDAVMRGGEPLILFTTLARDRRLFFKLFSAGLLDRGHLSIRQREIVIDRTTALCNAEYEWGVHVAAYAAKAGLDAPQIASLVEGVADEEHWSDGDRVLIRLCDSLHRSCSVDDELWESLTRYHSDEAIIELLMLAGYYRMISYLVNGLRLPLEPNAPRFADIHGLGQQFRLPAGE